MGLPDGKRINRERFLGALLLAILGSAPTPTLQALRMNAAGTTKKILRCKFAVFTRPTAALRRGLDRDIEEKKARCSLLSIDDKTG